MAINRGKIKRLERAAQAETLVLSCPECGQQLWVEENADLEYLAHQWTLQSGAQSDTKSYRQAPRDVLLIVNHPHDAENLINTRTGERWLERLENAGGRHVD